MDVAALVISIFALLAAGWSAWGTHRQAKATEAQAKAADHANRTAQEALDLARESEKRDAERQHVEERPTFAVSGRRAKDRASIVIVTITNEGPLEYENVIVKPDMDDAETKRIVRGMGRRSDHLADEVALGSSKPGETLNTALVRHSPDHGGKAKLLVTASRSAREWTTVHYVTVAVPPRAISF